jgi:hypothetical protein
MNCIDLEILEAWRRPDTSLEWERVPELERVLREPQTGETK